MAAVMIVMMMMMMTDVSMTSPCPVNESVFYSMDTRLLMMWPVSTLSTGATRHFWSLIIHCLLHLPQSCPEGCFSVREALYPLFFWQIQLILQISP